MCVATAFNGYSPPKQFYTITDADRCVQLQYFSKYVFFILDFISTNYSNARSNTNGTKCFVCNDFDQKD
jgi:hypothetical protein